MICKRLEFRFREKSGSCLRNKRKVTARKWKLSYCRYSDLLLLCEKQFSQVTAIFSSKQLQYIRVGRICWRATSRYLVCSVHVCVHVKTFWQNPEQPAATNGVSAQFQLIGDNLCWRASFRLKSISFQSYYFSSKIRGKMTTEMKLLCCKSDYREGAHTLLNCQNWCWLIVVLVIELDKWKVELYLSSFFFSKALGGKFNLCAPLNFVVFLFSTFLLSIRCRSQGSRGRKELGTKQFGSLQKNNWKPPCLRLSLLQTSFISFNHRPMKKKNHRGSSFVPRTWPNPELCQT